MMMMMMMMMTHYWNKLLLTPFLGVMKTVAALATDNNDEHLSLPPAPIKV
jgi:hypothetical protein